MVSKVKIYQLNYVSDSVWINYIRKVLIIDKWLYILP